jgi:hypothetical protein
VTLLCSCVLQVLCSYTLELFSSFPCYCGVILGFHNGFIFKKIKPRVVDLSAFINKRLCSLMTKTLGCFHIEILGFKLIQIMYMNFVCDDVYNVHYNVNIQP